MSSDYDHSLKYAKILQQKKVTYAIDAHYYKQKRLNNRWLKLKPKN